MRLGQLGARDSWSDNLNFSVRLATNLVTGSDHPIELMVKTLGTVDDRLNFPLITNPVDQVEVWKDNAASAIATGLFDPGTGFSDYNLCREARRAFARTDNPKLNSQAAIASAANIMTMSQMTIATPDGSSRTT